MPAKGFTSITIREEAYKKIKEIASSKGMRVAELVERLLDHYERRSALPLILTESVEPKRVEWTWPGPYVYIVTDPKVQVYMSTAWIRSKEYPEKAGRPQWVPEIESRVRSDEKFRVEKVFVISKKAWDESEVWKWVGKWVSLNFAYGEKIKAFIVREDDALHKGVPELYFDMGIYGEQMVGFLQLDEESNPEVYYTISLPQKEITNAIKEFGKLKDCQLAPRDYKEKLLSAS